MWPVFLGGPFTSVLQCRLPGSGSQDVAYVFAPYCHGEPFAWGGCHFRSERGRGATILPAARLVTAARVGLSGLCTIHPAAGTIECK